MNQLRAIRKARGMTVAACAEAVNISPRRWTAYEAGESDPPPELRIAIADLLKTTLDDLAGRTATTF